MINRKNAHMFGIFAMAMLPPETFTPIELEEGKNKPNLKTNPKRPGQKEYFFNNVGEFSTTRMRKDECIFICFAINDKNAIKKFKKYVGTINTNQ